MTHLERIHNLKEVYTDFKIVLNLLRSGYRFDDSDAPRALKQLEKALKLLAEEISQLKESE